MQLDFFRRLVFLPFGLLPKPKPVAPLAPPVSLARVPAKTTGAGLMLDPVPLQARARLLVRELGRTALAEKVVVRWNPRMRSTAGTAHYGKWLISLNPRLHAFGQAEVDRTLLHELAHLLAHDRAGRRRIAPHGPEWRQACRDLGLVEEPRCHDLPLPRRELARRFTYECPHCKELLRRVKPLRRKVACSACCRTYSRGRYDDRFRFVAVKNASSGTSS